jgi:hypothetical protein
MPPSKRSLVLAPLIAAPLECRYVRGHILRQLLASTDDPRDVCRRVLEWRGIARGWGDDIFKLGCEALQVDTAKWAMTPGGYETLFTFVCKELQRHMEEPLHSMHHPTRDHPAYLAMGWHYREQVRREGRVIRYVPEHRPEFEELCSLAVQQDAEAILSVPSSHPRYTELASLAVQQTPQVLMYVRNNHPGFGEVARLAVERDADTLAFVPHQRPDFSDIAMIAARTDPSTLRRLEVYWTNPRYPEIARAAVEHDGLAIQYVMRQGSWGVSEEVYAELARLAVQQNPEALQHVARNHPVYAELAAARG